MNTRTGAVRRPVTHEERDACLHALGEMHAAGKLSLSELDARVQAALAAQTEDELARLLDEEPRGRAIPDDELHTYAARPQPPTAAPPRAETHSPPRNVSAGRRGRNLVVPVAIALVALLALAVVASVVALAIALVLAVGVLRVTAVLAVAAAAVVVYRALARRAAAGAAEAQTKSVSQELVLGPRAQVPAQRQPDKVHPVIVPGAAPVADEEVTLRRVDSVRELPSAERPALPAAPVAPARQVLSHQMAMTGGTVPAQRQRSRGLVSHLRPLVDRVASRSH